MSQVTTPAGAAPSTAPDWHSINWKKVWRTVRRLRARIVKAIQEGKWHKVEAPLAPLTGPDELRAPSEFSADEKLLLAVFSEGLEPARELTTYPALALPGLDLLDPLAIDLSTSLDTVR